VFSGGKGGGARRSYGRSGRTRGRGDGKPAVNRASSALSQARARIWEAPEPNPAPTPAAPRGQRAICCSRRSPDGPYPSRLRALRHARGLLTSPPPLAHRVDGQAPIRQQLLKWGPRHDAHKHGWRRSKRLPARAADAHIDKRGLGRQQRPRRQPQQGRRQQQLLWGGSGGVEATKANEALHRQVDSAWGGGVWVAWEAGAGFGYSATAIWVEDLRQDGVEGGQPRCGRRSGCTRRACGRRAHLCRRRGASRCRAAPTRTLRAGHPGCLSPGAIGRTRGRLRRWGPRRRRQGPLRR
jgi:hypothetical protein